jgi:transcriptional regulator with XRE-family HTH domain
MLTSLLEEETSSTGSNVTWLQSVLPDYSPEQQEDLYLLAIQRIRSLASTAQQAVVMRSDRDTLLYVKDQLSLTGRQLAAAMGVSRTALYQWLDEKATMRDRSRERLEKLRRLADQWLTVAGVPVSRSSWVTRADRALFVKELTGNKDDEYGDARSRLDQLAALKPSAKPSHRSVLEIAKENNWKKLPAHIRDAERSSRIPSARNTTD